jgi:hypothetical protein
MKRLTVRDINKMMWPTWEGPVDNIALEERIEDLLQHERDLIVLQGRLQEVRDFLRDPRCL